MHGTDEDKENADIIIDWINFLEKSIDIKRCPICLKKFTAKRRNQIYCSKECNMKNYWNKFTDEERKDIYKKFSKFKYDEKRKEYMKEYWENHKEKKKEYNKKYREKKKLENKE